MDAPLWHGCRERDARIAELQARVAELEARGQDQESESVGSRPASSGQTLGRDWLEEGGAQALALGGNHDEGVVIIIHPLRNAAVVLQLVGRTLHGILCSDRCRDYDGVPVLQRQVAGPI